MQSSGRDETYVPALNHDWLTPLYDPLAKWLTPEFKIKSHLVRQAGVREGQRVLDVGCGTGTLAVLVKQTHPGAAVYGLDGDAKILEIARRKAAKAGAELTLREGLSYRLPYDDGSFERVFSSLMLHHLTAENKRLTLAEMFRVLGPGGGLHVADFRRSNESLPSMFRETGFAEVREYAAYWTIFGTVSLWEGRRL